MSRGGSIMGNNKEKQVLFDGTNIMLLIATIMVFGILAYMYFSGM